MNEQGLKENRSIDFTSYATTMGLGWNHSGGNFFFSFQLFFRGVSHFYLNKFFTKTKNNKKKNTITKYFIVPCF